MSAPNISTHRSPNSLFRWTCQRLLHFHLRMSIEGLPGALGGLGHLVPREKRAFNNHGVVATIHPLGQERDERQPRVEAKERQKKPESGKRADGVVGKERRSRITHVAWEEPWEPFQDKILLVVEGLHWR